MAYNTDELYEKALEAIEKYNLFFLADVYAYLGISHNAFYTHFPTESERFNHLLSVTKANKINDLTAQTRVSKNINYKGTGYVYIVKCGDFDLYKIGISKSDPKKRLSALQSGCPFDLYMLKTFHCDHYSVLEIDIHRKYKEFKKRGEWFELSITQLEDVCNELSAQTVKQISLF